MRQDGLARRTDPAAPSEADYEAVCAALMATARGRAFLDEHARRARQADTAVALEALSRLEYLLRQNQDGAEASARLRIELRALMLAVASARTTFDKFEGALAKRETVMALFDLLEQRIGDLMGELPEPEPTPANENQLRAGPSTPVVAPVELAQLAQIVAAIEPRPPQPAMAAPEPPSSPASERPNPAAPQLAALAALIDAESPPATKTASHEAERFSDQAYVPFEYLPPEPVEDTAAMAQPAPPPVASPPPQHKQIEYRERRVSPAPTRELPRRRPDVIAQLTALTPAERIALFS
jgi:hypothetical protein